MTDAACLLIRDELLDDLLSALRRHDRIDSERALGLWRDDPLDPWDPDDADLGCPVAFFADGGQALTAWVQRETTLHLAAGRFEYALCLLEQYRRPFVPQDLSLRNPTSRKGSA